MRKLLLKGNNRGFSLVELSMLLATMGILAAFSIPMLNSAMRDMRLIGDARSMATNLAYARLSAASQMTHYQLSLNLARNQWSVAKLNRASDSYEIQGAVNSLSSAGTSQEAIFKSNSVSAPSGFPTSSSTTITFNSRGFPIEGPRIIYLSNSAVNYAVTVSLTGRVQLWRLSKGQWVTQ